MRNSISVNGLGMCGIVSDSSMSATFCVWDIWLSYCNHFRKNVAEDRPVSVVRELATWSNCGKVIFAPTSVFITLEL